MKIINYREKALENILGYFRASNDIIKFIDIFAKRNSKIQDAILYLLSSYNINFARGIFLDFIGLEVGANRDDVDYGNYLCVNRLHINSTKNFYFLSSGADPRTTLTLEDAEFLQKIYAYIGTNCSTGNIYDTLEIIKTITNTNNIYLRKGDNLGIKINITGQNLILTQNTINYIKKILGDGIYLEEITTND